MQLLCKFYTPKFAYELCATSLEHDAVVSQFEVKFISILLLQAKNQGKN